jgi:hypothetical protein
MWREPYLETCCRSALHRVILAGAAGRPPAGKDAPCLARLTQMGFVTSRADGRYETTMAGAERHAQEILRRRPLTVVSST